MAFRCGARLGDSLGGVVICHRHDFQGGSCDLIDQVSRRKLSVRRGRVKVEIDKRRNDAAGVILVRRAQRVIRICSFRLLSPLSMSVSMFRAGQKQQDTGTSEKFTAGIQSSVNAIQRGL